jgi:hypothetical protein
MATENCQLFFPCCEIVFSHKLNRECVFVFASKKTKRRWRFSFFISTLAGCRIWSRAGRADLAFGSLPLTHD